MSTMAGWWRLATTLASWISMERALGAMSESWSEMRLMATGRSRARSLASYTSPMPPRPSRWLTSYLPIMRRRRPGRPTAKAGAVTSSEWTLLRIFLNQDIETAAAEEPKTRTKPAAICHKGRPSQGRLGVSGGASSLGSTNWPLWRTRSLSGM